MEQQQPYPTQHATGETPGGPGPSPPPRVHDAPPPAPPGDWSRAASYARDPRRKSPALAAILSLMPGLGQVYVGYYQRGFIHILVIASIIALLAGDQVEGLEPFFGLFLAFFWLYNVVDAGRRAMLYNLALQGQGPGALPEELEMPGLRGSIAGGVVLIGGGLILLLHTRFGVSLDWVADWWPVAPILFGAYLVYKAVDSSRTTT